MKKMKEEPKFEIYRLFGGDLCVTVDSLDNILAKQMYGNPLNLKPEEQDLVRAVLGRIRFDLNTDVWVFTEEERRGKINGRKTEV